MSDEILRIVNGSKLYGTDTAQSDDDFVSIFVESSEDVFMGRYLKTRAFGTTGPQERAKAGDIDGVAYSLRHFIDLTAKGNPSTLALLFAPRDKVVVSTEQGWQLLKNRDLFVSQLAVPRFRGYMQSQLLRLTGVKAGHIPNRPEIVEQHGYDTKYASQVARLAFQGIEYIKTGNITLPMPYLERQMVREIRAGRHSYDEAIEYLQTLDEALRRESDNCKLKEHPEWKMLGQLSQSIHINTWRNQET
jgi:hypothetical protein